MEGGTNRCSPASLNLPAKIRKCWSEVWASGNHTWVYWPHGQLILVNLFSKAETH